MRVDGNGIRPNMVIDYQNSLWRAVKTMAVKPGKGGAYNQVELKNLFDGRKLNERFRASESVERVTLEQVDCQYLYDNGDTLVFMENDTFEQVELQKSFLDSNQLAFLESNMNVILERHEERYISIKLPDNVVCTIVEAEPVVKGQTASSSYKPAILENGVRVMVPPFISSGERIVVNTETLEYSKRAE